MKLKLLFPKIYLLVLLSITTNSLSFAYGDDDDWLANLDEIDLDTELLEKASPAGSRALITPGTANMLGEILVSINLKKPLWLTTKPQKGRDILYLMPSKITAIEYGGGSCNLFFNMTSQMNLTGNSLLNIDQIDANGVIAAAGLARGNLGIKNTNQIPALLPFGKKISIQERKFGSYFQVGFSRGPFLIQLHTSLQLGERNFYLSNRDLIEIKALNNLIFGTTEYDTNSLFRLRVGLGDTRIKLGLNTLNSKNIQTDVGVECIIPTSRLSRKPLKAVNLETLLSDDTEVFKAALDGMLTLRDYLLTPEIGNGGHVGLGFFMESKYNLFNNLAELVTRFSFDKFFAADEQRLMLDKQTADVSADALAVLPIASTDAQAKAAIINFAKQYLIPLPYRLSIEPGGIFNGIMILNVPYKAWNFRYGYDFYFQQADRFKQVYADADVVNSLRTDLASVGMVTQHKISSEMTYKIKNFNNINLDIGLGGDTTIFASNIGKDWTMYLKLASEF